MSQGTRDEPSDQRILRRASELRNEAIEAMREATKSTLATCATVRGEYGPRIPQRKPTSFLRRWPRMSRPTAWHGASGRANPEVLGAKAEMSAAHRNATMSQIARWASARSKADQPAARRSPTPGDLLMKQTAELPFADFADAHGKMAKQQRATLKSGHQKLRADTAAIRQCDARRSNEGACHLVEFPGRQRGLANRISARDRRQENAC